MDWDKLRIFHAVARAGSFTGAGTVLNLSQSAISRQVSALEQSLDVVLFHRHARGIGVSHPAGAELDPLEALVDAIRKIETRRSAPRSRSVLYQMRSRQHR